MRDDDWMRWHLLDTVNIEVNAFGAGSTTPVGQKFDDDKPQPALMPAKAELEVVRVLTMGARKYSPENWRKVSHAKDRYLNAAMRHISAHRCGEGADPESGLHPLAHAIASLLFVLELELEQCSSTPKI